MGILDKWTNKYCSVQPNQTFSNRSYLLEVFYNPVWKKLLDSDTISKRQHYCEITNLRSVSVLPIHSLLSMISETKCTLPDPQITLKNLLRSNWICRFTGQPQATAGNRLPRMLQDKYWCLPAGQCQLFLFCRSPCSSPRNGLLDHGFSTRWDPHQTDEEAVLI